MIEEMLLMAARWGVYGGDIDRICEMDVVSFSFMVGLITRIELREKYMAAWTGMVSAQGTHKGMKQWTKPWMDIISGKEGSTVPTSGTVSAPDDSAQFKSKFGRGF